MRRLHLEQEVRLQERPNRRGHWIVCRKSLPRRQLSSELAPKVKTRCSRRPPVEMPQTAHRAQSVLRVCNAPSSGEQRGRVGTRRSTEPTEGLWPMTSCKTLLFEQFPCVAKVTHRLPLRTILSVPPVSPPLIAFLPAGCRGRHPHTLTWPPHHRSQEGLVDGKPIHAFSTPSGGSTGGGGTTSAPS